MRIVSLVIGTRGDVEIALRLAGELARRGHELTIATSPFFAERIAAAGHRFEPIGDGRLDDLTGLFRELSSVADRSERIRRYAERWLRPQLAASRRSIARLLGDHDASFNNLRLFDPVRSRPTALLTYDPPSDARRYGATPPPPHVLELVALDRDLVDPHRDWADHLRFTGFFEPEYAAPLAPGDADRIDRFLENGAPPVVLTMGSMTCCDAEALRGRLLAACRLVDRRLLTIVSWSGLESAVGADTLTVREAPYDRVFAAAACVVHHGGCGTVVSVLRAGKPSIVAPQITSQATFAALLAGHDLSAGAIATDRPDPIAVAQTIRRALEDPAIAGACAAWRTRLTGRDGAAVAAGWFEQHAARFDGGVRS